MSEPAEPEADATQDALPDGLKNNKRIVSSERLVSLDVFRGLIMCSLAINGFALAKTAAKLKYGINDDVNSWVGQVWQWLAFHNSHPDWNSQFYVVGFAYWDLIQPAFMFMVGVAMPYSYASRRAKGHTNNQLAVHAFIRAIVLTLLGVYLQTRNTGLESNRLFTNVLSQIGLGYFFVFLLLGLRPRIQWCFAVIVLVGYWYWQYQYPVVEPLPAPALKSIESLHLPPSVANQFAKASNAPADADVWLLNRIVDPEKPIVAHKAGYTTLNFVPSMVTILFGVSAGTLLRSERKEMQKVKLLVSFGLAAMFVAVVASYTFCPIVKKIWTPSWVLFSGAWVVWILAGLYWFVDIKGFKKWTYPIVVVGANSLAIYLMSMLFKGAIQSQLKVYMGLEWFDGPYGFTSQAIAVFCVLWLICLYLYRNKLFLRI